jgi:hypothetical protein
MAFDISKFGSASVSSASKLSIKCDPPTGTILKLSSEQLAHARAFLEKRAMPASHLENVQFIKGMKGHGWVVDQALKNGNPAITRGNIVYVRDDYWAKATDPSKETFWSEIFHTSQYQLGNFESNYLSGIIGSIFTGGDGHKRNILEEVAHNRGQAMADQWNTRR